MPALKFDTTMGGGRSKGFFGRRGRGECIACKVPSKHPSMLPTYLYKACWHLDQGVSESALWGPLLFLGRRRRSIADGRLNNGG